MNKTFSANVTPEIADFLETTFHPEDSVLREIRERSSTLGLPQIHVAPMDGLHLEVLARACGARKIVEIGTLAGYSGVCLARALPKDGVLYTFDADRKHMEVATESFRRAGVIEQVRTFVGPATQNLPGIASEGPFDLVFVDADKEGYPAYLSWAAENLRVGGLLIGDNTLGWGMIADQKFEDAEDEAAIRALQRFNQELGRKLGLGPSGGGRFRATLLPTGEGLTVGVKIR